ncbi:2325_t:CDS:2, partial [Racocetra fulgida]
QKLAAKNQYLAAEKQYLAAIDKLLKVACASDDHTKAFEILQQIQNEGNDQTKEASRLGHTHARVWANIYNSSDDFGASVVIDQNM